MLAGRPDHYASLAGVRDQSPSTPKSKPGVVRGTRRGVPTARASRLHLRLHDSADSTKQLKPALVISRELLLPESGKLVALCPLPAFGKLPLELYPFLPFETMSRPN
jgi:hypothetical protein